MMWLLLLLVSIAHSSEGEKRMILRDGSNPCEGHVEVYYENQRGYVGDKYWSSATEAVVCRSAHCGNSTPNTVDVDRDSNRTVWLNELICNGTEEHLWDCKCPGWNISSYRKPSVKKIKCSNEIKFDLDGFNCAGAVRFSKDNGQSWTGYLCADNWGKLEADILCKSLKCGEAKEPAMDNWMIWKDFESQKRMMISCSDISPIDNLWQCVTKESTVCTKPASVVCNGYERLQLRGQASNVCSGQLEIEEKGKWIPVDNNRRSPNDRCQQMHCGSAVSHTVDGNGTQLTCSDKVKVVLMDNNDKNPSVTSHKCYGAVHIKNNGTIHPVCNSGWDLTAAQVVCKELNCGKAISINDYRKVNIKGVMDSVSCLGTEASLWHCRAKHSLNSSLLDCSSKAHVVCADSIDVRLMDGPGRCAGRVEINYEGSWRQVDKNGWKDENSHTVCTQMKCGNKGKSSPEKFSSGSRDFLTKAVNCESSASRISDCLVNESKSGDIRERETVGIICKKHIVVFLKGDASTPCSGMVGIEHDGNTKWLSGSNKTWNQEAANAVCQQRKCGVASSFNVSTDTATADMRANVWDKSYNCSENSKSLFNCTTTTPPSDHNNTIATVNCTGTVTFEIKGDCWGNVIANVTGRAGGVCGDTWTLKHSEMLCMSQGCGSKVLTANRQPEPQTLLIKSLHSTKQTPSLTQSNFVLNDENNSCLQKPAYVVCSGSVKPRFSVSVDKCSGNVEVFYDGTWLPVCTDALKNKDAQRTICQELGCGHAVEQISHFGPAPKERHVISQLGCQNVKSLSECNITSVLKDKSCFPAGLVCADSRKMTVRGTCRGPVSIFSKGNHHAVSFEGWTDSAGDQLCKDLNCGRFKSKFISPVTNVQAFWSENFNCTKENRKNIWDCENNDTSPSLNKPLSIECTDKPNVTVSGECHGEVKINGMKVCNSQWNDAYSDLLCQEIQCSNAVHKIEATNSQSGDVNHYVRCDDDHYELSQCKRVNGTCDGQPLSVYCVGNVKFKTTRHCGGQILVMNGLKWENICPLSKDNKIKELLCKELNCDPFTDFGPQSTAAPVKSLKLSLECTAHHMDIKHCLTRKECVNSKPAEIYCGGYEAPSHLLHPHHHSVSLPLWE
ncbi:hypothetical protein INR49_030612 [Caranx melampygus]|nr:hypothetical protein INR49_030612 [Caranx melampygus]